MLLRHAHRLCNKYRTTDPLFQVRGVVPRVQTPRKQWPGHVHRLTFMLTPWHNTHAPPLLLLPLCRRRRQAFVREFNKVAPTDYEKQAIVFRAFLMTSCAGNFNPLFSGNAFVYTGTGGVSSGACVRGWPDNWRQVSRPSMLLLLTRMARRAARRCCRHRARAAAAADSQRGGAGHQRQHPRHARLDVLLPGRLKGLLPDK